MHEKFQKPFAVFAIPLSVFIGVAVVLLEVFLDYRDDLEVMRTIVKITLTVMQDISFVATLMH